MSISHNVSRPKSTLKKKHYSISCHAVRESVAINESLCRNIPSGDNVADPLIKVVNDQKK